MLLLLIWVAATITWLLCVIMNIILLIHLDKIMPDPDFFNLHVVPVTRPLVQLSSDKDKSINSWLGQSLFS